MGRALGSAWQNGHDVTYGVRNPDDPKYADLGAAVVTNDTGISHLAAAVETPSVVVFTVTDPVRWKPEAPIHIAVRAGRDVTTTAARVAETALALAE